MHFYLVSLIIQIAYNLDDKMVKIKIKVKIKKRLQLPHYKTIRIFVF